MISMPFIFSNVLGGPVWAAIATVYVIVIAVSVFVCVDAFRAKRQERFAEILEPRVLYVGLNLVFLLSVVGVWLPPVPRDWSLVPVMFTPLALATSTAYLLRVVFPAPPPGDYITGDEARAETTAHVDSDPATDAASPEPTDDREPAPREGDPR